MPSLKHRPNGSDKVVKNDIAVLGRESTPSTLPSNFNTLAVEKLLVCARLSGLMSVIIISESTSQEVTSLPIEELTALRLMSSVSPAFE
jgi:hypothetical protein